MRADAVLTAANRAALANVRVRAVATRPGDVDRIARALAAVDVEADPETVVAALRDAGPLTLNFHPDRLVADGRSVAKALRDEGVYRSQFETGISNGGLTAHPGGDRDRWEEALFGGAYQAAGVGGHERPKYGGLNLMRHRTGACIGFGSCHLRLRPAARARATILLGDSVTPRSAITVADAPAPVVGPLLEQIAATGVALGRDGATVRGFVAGLLDGDAAAGRGLFAPAIGRSLADYVEAHVHGPLRLDADVEAIVVDGAFAGTATGDALAAAAERHGAALEWHPGFAIAVADVPGDVPDVADEEFEWQRFCAGGRARRMAERVAAGAEHVDAAAIGAAAAGVVRDPRPWADWGPPAAVLQELKYVWRILVSYGAERAVSPS